VAAAAIGPRGVHEVEQVRAFDVIELERPRERVEYVVGDAADAAALDARVVLDRDAGEEATSSRRRPGTRRRPP